MAKDFSSVVSSGITEKPATEFVHSSVAGDSADVPAISKEAERIRRIESSLESVTAIVADKRQDWQSFLAEDNGTGAKAAKDLITALLKVYPE